MTGTKDKSGWDGYFGGGKDLIKNTIQPETSARRIRLFRNVHKLGESKVRQGSGHLWWEDFNDMETRADILV